jgi:hypothetical protein
MKKKYEGKRQERQERQERQQKYATEVFKN